MNRCEKRKEQGREERGRDRTNSKMSSEAWKWVVTRPREMTEGSMGCGGIFVNLVEGIRARDLTSSDARVAMSLNITSFCKTLDVSTVWSRI